MSRFYITFSNRYRTEEHPVQSDIDPDGWVSVEADSLEKAQTRAYEVFNAYYDNLVHEDVFDRAAFSLGELYRI